MRDVRGGSITLALALFGCNYNADGLGGGTSTSGSSTSGGGELGESTKGSAEGSSTTVVAEGSGSSDATGPTGGTTSESGDSTTGAPLPTARSCAEILEEDPKAETGVHSILSTSDDAVVEVWCEMEVDGGGWTLVARSGSGGSGAFGWGVARGELEDISQPYSLDAVSVGLPFTEVLVGERSGWAAVVEHAYVVTVPEGFLEDYTDSTHMTEPARTVVGDCEPSGGPEMLQRIGHTASEETYFFRDIVDYDVHGLQPDELVTYYDDCNRGGNLDDQQGVLFVR